MRRDRILHSGNSWGHSYSEGPARLEFKKKIGFEGKVLKGWPILTIVRGDIVYDNGNVYEVKAKEVVYEKPKPPNLDKKSNEAHQLDDQGGDDDGEQTG